MHLSIKHKMFASCLSILQETSVWRLFHSYRSGVLCVGTEAEKTRLTSLKSPAPSCRVLSALERTAEQYLNAWLSCCTKGKQHRHTRSSVMPDMKSRLPVPATLLTCGHLAAGPWAFSQRWMQVKPKRWPQRRADSLCSPAVVHASKQIVQLSPSPSSPCDNWREAEATDTD